VIAAPAGLTGFDGSVAPTSTPLNGRLRCGRRNLSGKEAGSSSAQAQLVHALDARSDAAAMHH
jgi:hypothetical protein